MTIIRLEEFDRDQQDIFAALCASNGLDPASFDVIATVESFTNRFAEGHVYVRRAGVVHSYYACDWLDEFEASLPTRLAEEAARQQPVPSRYPAGALRGSAA